MEKQEVTILQGQDVYSLVPLEEPNKDERYAGAVVIDGAEKSIGLPGTYRRIVLFVNDTTGHVLSEGGDRQ